MLQELVKAMLQDCVQKSHPPPPNRVQHLAYLLSHFSAGDNEREVEPASQRILLFVLAETMKETFSRCSFELNQAQYADTTPDNSKNDLHSPWIHLAGFHDALPFFLTPLRILSCHASMILHVLISLADCLNLRHTYLMINLEEQVWNVGLTCLVHGPLEEVMGGSEWHVCLAKAALCLVITEVLRTVRSAYDTEEAGLGCNKCVIMWGCEEIVSPLLNDLEQEFPTFLYQRYCQHEKEERDKKVGDRTVGHVLRVRKIMLFSFSAIYLTILVCIN